jgi:hypothetical protein
MAWAYLLSNVPQPTSFHTHEATLPVVLFTKWA